MNSSPAMVLMQRVARRAALGAFGLRFHYWLLITGGAYLLLLLASRLLGVFPPWFGIASLGVVPAVALAGAVGWYRRINPPAAARLIDERLATQDLFLTAALLQGAVGGFKPLVQGAANQRAATIRPSQVVRYRWRQRLASGGGALVCLGAAVLWLPQFDPFGREQKRLEFTQQVQHLASTRRATALRVAALQQRANAADHEKLQQAVADLGKTFQAMKPNERQGNLTRLEAQQKELGQLWKQLNEARLGNALTQAPAHQGLGATDPAKLQRWKDDLQKGDSSSVKQELEALRELARQMAATTDPAARDRLRQQLASRLQALSDALGQNLNSAALNAALQRALEQLDLSKLTRLSGDALKGLVESLQLSEQEMRQLAQGLSDLRQLEDALKTLQLARRLNGMQPLDGQQAGGCKNLGDYAALYESLYESACRGHGGDGLGPGLGEGERPYGDESQVTAYRPEQAPSPLQAGKILLQWKTRDVSTPGKAREDFQRAIADIRQQASEAVAAEQIPPGYQPAIQHYFDSLSESPAPASKP